MDTELCSKVAEMGRDYHDHLFCPGIRCRPHSTMLFVEGTYPESRALVSIENHRIHRNAGCSSLINMVRTIFGRHLDLRLGTRRGRLHHDKDGPRPCLTASMVYRKL